MPGGQDISGRDRTGNRFYPYAEQTAHYRAAAWARGCTCPALPPHVHLIDCPLYEVPGGVPPDFHRHAPAAEAVPSPGVVGHAIEPVSSRKHGSRETEPGEGGEPTQLNASPGAGVYRLLADREEDRAADRYWENRER